MRNGFLLNRSDICAALECENIQKVFFSGEK